MWILLIPGGLIFAIALGIFALKLALAAMAWVLHLVGYYTELGRMKQRHEFEMAMRGHKELQDAQRTTHEEA